MNVRNLSITVAALLVLCGIAWYLQRPAPAVSADPRVGKAVLPTDVATKAARVHITDTGKDVQLVRNANGSWTVTSYYDFPADFSKLSRLVDDLTEAKIQRLVTALPERLERLGFKDTSITLSDADGKKLWSITLGKDAEGGGRFLRYGDEKKGYLANLTTYLDTTPKNWADTSLLSLKADDVAKVELGFDDPKVAPVVVSRATKQDPWTSASTPKGDRMKQDRISALLSNFSTLRFTDTAAPDDARVKAAHDHSRTLKFTTFDGKSWTVTLGRKPEEKKPKPPTAEKKEEPAKTTSTNPTTKPAEPAKPKEPEMETIPAGPVYASITSSDANAPLNSLMQKRAFEISSWTYTNLPAAPADLFEPVPPPPPAPAKPAATPKPDGTAKPAVSPAPPKS